jgi:transcriptional regulator with GAF, ATPase, and Fis domain
VIELEPVEPLMVLTVEDGPASESAVGSTIPDEGISLYDELRRYQDWLVTQALIKSLGNRAKAARLLGLKRTTLVMMLRANALATRRHAP